MKSVYVLVVDKAQLDQVCDSLHEQMENLVWYWRKRPAKNTYSPKTFKALITSTATMTATSYLLNEDEFYRQQVIAACEAGARLESGWEHDGIITLGREK